MASYFELDGRGAHLLSIPDYQSVMLPLLTFVADGAEHSTHEVVESLASTFGLTDADRQELLPSGQQPTFANRVGWAASYMKKAGLLEPTRRGFVRITERGKNVLEEKPVRIDVKLLERFPEFLEFRKRKSVDDIPEVDKQNLESQTPGEAIEVAYQRIQNELADDLLQQIKSCSPTFFERLVVDLLVTMGYGGTRKDAGQAVGKSGDGGIDGIIKGLFAGLSG